MSRNAIPHQRAVPGLTVPDLAHRRHVQPAHYAMSVIDTHGRIASSPTVEELAWEPGNAIAFTVDNDGLITACRCTAENPPPSTAPQSTVDPRRHITLPALTRRRAGITTGDRLLLSTDHRTELLAIYPPGLLTAILREHSDTQMPQP